MNTFKRKSLYAALAGVSALGVTGAAQAVNLNPDGLGQVLIYPYYTVNAGQQTLLSLVNTIDDAGAEWPVSSANPTNSSGVTKPRCG